MKLTNKRVQLMGTFIDISIYHGDPLPLLEQATSLLHYYNGIFSANDDTSELMAINKASGQRPIPVRTELFNLIKVGKEASSEPNSHLNIAIGPIVKLWQIGFANADVPDEGAINLKLNLTNPADIILDEDKQTVFLSKRGMELDLGALAKGYIADQIIDFLKQNHVQAGFANLGGNVLTFGPAFHNPDQLWRVGIRMPFLPPHHNAIILKLRDKSIVTSGVYERQLEKNGRIYHHIFDRKTGHPLKTDMSSLTIISQTSLLGDLMSSKLFGQGNTNINKQLTNAEKAQFISISNQNKICLTKDLISSINQINPRLTLIEI